MKNLNLRFQYSFNDEGIYSGLVYKNKLGLFPSNSTSLEPIWRKGHLPLWDFKNSCWGLIRRDERRVIEFGLDALEWQSEKFLNIVKNSNENLDNKFKAVCDMIHDQSCEIQVKRDQVKKLTEMIHMMNYSIYEMRSELNELNKSAPVKVHWFRKFLNLFRF